MKRLLLALLAAFGLAAPLHAEITPADLEVFFELVAVGPTTAVAASLTDTSALATARDPYGFEAIHMLDYADFDAKLDLLQRHGATINARNDDGIGLIHILIDPMFLPAVLSAGADINLRDRFGRTPLMLFAHDPDGADMVRALIAGGADITLRDNDGHSVLYYAQERGPDDNLVQALIAAGAPE